MMNTPNIFILGVIVVSLLVTVVFFVLAISWFISNHTNYASHKQKPSAPINVSTIYPTSENESTEKII